MFEFMFVMGLILAYYGFSVMKNPRVWGDQGRDRIKEEHWNAYVHYNGQFIMYFGFFFAAVAALDIIFSFGTIVYILILLGGLVLMVYPLAHWMHENEGSWWPWPRKKK